MLFESGSIVLHIAGRSPALMPEGDEARARVTTWVFAAMNSMEPPISNLGDLDLFWEDKDLAERRRPAATAAVRARLADLAAALGDRHYLTEGRFTAADLMMTTVLQILRDHPYVAEQPSLEAFRLRCEDRPAYRKALADQMAVFVAHAPPEAP